MSLSEAYSKENQVKLLDSLWKMLSESLSIESSENTASTVAEMCGEVVELIALSERYMQTGVRKKYEMRVYVSNKGVVWQATTTEANEA